MNWINSLILLLLITTIVILEINARRRYRVEQLTRIQRDLGIILTSATKIEEVLDRCLRAAASTVRAECSAYLQYAADDSAFHLKYQRRCPPELLSTIDTLRSDDPLGKTILVGEIIKDKQIWTLLDQIACSDPLQLKDILIVPVHGSASIMGCILLGTTHQRRTTPNLVNALEIIATFLSEMTASIQAEQALLENERTYRTLIMNAPTGILYLNTDGQILDVNPKLLEILGSPSVEQTKAINIFTFPPLVQAGTVEAIKRSIKTRESVHHQHSYTSKWGKTAYIRYTITPIKNSNDVVSTILLNVEDITESKHMEELREMIYRISEAVHAVPSLEDLFERLHNIIKEQLPADNFYFALYDEKQDLITFPYFKDDSDTVPEDKKMGKGLTEYVLRSGEPLLATPDVFQQLVERGDVLEIGTPSIDWVGIPLKTEESGTIGVMVLQTYSDRIRFGPDELNILTFVSDQLAMSIQQKKMQDELNHYKDHLLEMVDTRTQELHQSRRDLQEERDLFVGGQVVVFKLKYESGLPILYSSPNAIQLFGYSADEFMSTSKHFADTLYSEDKERVLYTIEQAVLEGHATLAHTPYRIVHREGQIIWLQDFTTFLRNKAGDVEALLGYVIDITVRIHAEEELQKKQAQLVQAGRMSSLGEMATGVAHELNQPLAIIRVQAELLKLGLEQGDMSPDQMQNDITVVIEEVDRAAGVIDQLRGFASSNITYQEPTSLNQHILKSMIFFQEQFRVQGIDLILDLDPTLPSVIINPQHFEQMVVNLLSNSKWAVEMLAKEEKLNSPKMIRVSTHLDHESHRVLVTVLDTGIGMTEEILEHCMEPFYTQKGVGEGAGLGLSIVRGLIREFDGFIDISSDTGKGTSVTLSFQPHLPDDSEENGIAVA